MSLLKIHDKKCRKAGKKEQEGGKSANSLAQPILTLEYACLSAEFIFVGTGGTGGRVKFLLTA